MKKIIGKIRAAIDQYGMINSGDKIAVGVSGGKDSMVLVKALLELKGYYSVPFDIVGITLDTCFNDKMADYSKIQDFMNTIDVEYVIKRTQLGKVIFDDRKEKNPCSLCARMRRGLLHNTALELGCNKVALGHHLDDAVETFFMNLFNGGSVGCFSPVSYLSKKDLYLIRPMIYCYEREIENVSTRNEIPVEKSNCPVDGKTNREDVKLVLKELEKKYPSLRKKVITSLQNGNIDNWGRII